MLRDADRVAWRAIGTTVGGRPQEQQPNREALRWLFPTETTAVLAIAAGQKHARHFRSHEGARLAVEATLSALQDYATRQENDLAALHSAGWSDLPGQIIQRWRQTIADTLLSSPLTIEELMRLEQQEGPLARQEIESHPLLVYDTTLFAVLVIPGALLTLHIGSGELLLVADNGQVTNLFSRNTLEISSQASSLCTVDITQPIQSTMHPLGEQPPALLVLATTGYPRTFHNEAAFMLIGTNLLTLLRADGLERGQSSIEKWLTEAAQEGQGDDMTLAVLCRLAALQPPASPEPETDVLIKPFPSPPFPAEDGFFPEDIREPARPFAERVDIPFADEVKTEGTEGRHERPALPPYRPRSARTLVATVQCRRTKRFFQLRIESKGHGRWVATQASGATELAGRGNVENVHTFSGELSVDPLYSGCPHCQAERLAQCSCGQAACWDGSRRAITCPWCAVISEGSNHIEELSAYEER